MIRSVYYNQQEIISSVMELCHIDRFDADVTYGNGQFYKNMTSPKFCFDIDSEALGKAAASDDSIKITASSNNIPLDDNSVSSLMFDPPFLTYVKAAREHNSIMAKRFGGYWRYDELEDHYKSTIN